MTRLEYYTEGVGTVKQLRELVNAAKTLALVPIVYIRCHSLTDAKTGDLIFPFGWEKVYDIGYKNITLFIDGHTAICTPDATFDVKIEYKG